MLRSANSPVIIAGTSPWIAIGPALIAGGIGAFSAALSYLAAKRSLDRADIEGRAQRNSQLDLAVWDRRLQAIETAWLHMYYLERSPTLAETARHDLARALVWLPEQAAQAVLTLLEVSEGGDATATQAALTAVRASLVTSIGANLTRLMNGA